MTGSLSTDRLLLRRWKSSDRLPFREMNADPEVMRFFPDPLTARESDNLADRIEAEFEEKGWGLWAVEVRPGAVDGLAAGEFLGFIGFHEATFDSDFTPCPEIGWRLSRRAWGRGLATEGARRCLELGRENLGFGRIISFAPLVNRPSISVMEKIGLVRDREFNHPSLPEDHPIRRHVLYRTGA